MTGKKFDVVGIGNAIVDVVAQVPETFITKHSLKKSSMTLIDRQKAETIYKDMPPAIECSGGSVANSIAGVASLGGKPAFIGKVNDDQLGRIFAHDLHAIGAHYNTHPATDGGATARCLVAVTPDAHRTMATYLGDKVDLTPHDIDASVIKEAQVLYVEGYLWDDRSATKQAIVDAMTIARDAGVKVAFTLSDPWCVDRHRDGFLYLMESYIDILFANEQEIISLLKVDDFETAARHIAQKLPMAALTRSEKGSVVIQDKIPHEIQPGKDVKVVDTTGAGDLYASGFLYGLTRGYSIKEAGELATVTASHIIGHLGARPQVKLSTLNPFNKKVA